MPEHSSSLPRGDLPSVSSSLLDRVREMEPHAWGQLVEVFGPIIYRWCRQSGLRGHDAADVVQDVFAAVARNIGRFERRRESGSFRAWLATITRNRVRDAFRQAARTPQATGGAKGLQQLRDLQLESLDETISETRLHSAVPQQVLDLVRAEFEPSTWQAFWQTTIDGRPPRDVGEEMGLSVASVYQAKSRVLRRLRRRLEEIP